MSALQPPWYFMLIMITFLGNLITILVAQDHKEDMNVMEFNITTTWDSLPTNHSLIKIALLQSENPGVLSIDVRAPFFNDPPAPSGKPGETFPSLWNYEVVEAFFLNEKEEYLEVELCPHGQHLVLLLSGARNAIQAGLPLNFKSTVEGDSWHGLAEVPASYFPPDVNMFNAYAIHGSEEKRRYESLYPVPHGQFTNPDFHRLEYFKPITFSDILPSNANSSYSDVWVNALKDSANS